MRIFSILTLIALAGCATSHSASNPNPSLMVQFDTAKATLSPDGKRVIDNAVSQYNSNANPVMITVAGYADSQGDEYYNLSLSASRAETVKRALVGHGIPTTQVQMRAYGISEPMDGTQPTAPQNRRVVIAW